VTGCCTACASAGGACSECLNTGHPHAGGGAECCTCPLGDFPHPPHEPGLRTLPPTLCRLEYWDGEQWVCGAAAESLLYPARYVDRLAGNGRVGRVTLLDTGEVIQKGDPASGPVDPVLARLRYCPWCCERHPFPHDGMCLI
jgi:hypothetical protein